MATGGCFLVQPSPDTRLWFSTASDYLKHLISSGVHYADVQLQLQGPLASQLHLEQPPLKPESLSRGEEEQFFATSISQTPARKRSTTFLKVQAAEDQKDLSDHLLYALAHGLVQGVQQVLERSPDTDLSAALPCANDQELPPLAVAALLPTVQCLELLISKGAPANSTDSRGRSPLHWAVLGGRLAAVKTLLRHSSEANSEDDQGLTPLLYATLSGAQGIVAALLKAGASADHQHTSTGVTALSLACLCDQPEIAKLLLKHRAMPGLADSQGCSPLHCAAWGGSRRCVKLLLSQNPALLVGRDHSGRTPLLYAAAKGDAVMCQHLLKKGAQLTEMDSEGRTAVHWAVMSSQVSCLEALLECVSGPDLCNQADNHGAAPIHYAAMLKECEVLSTLQNKGASLSAVDTDGYTPLIWAAASGHVNTLKQLLEHNERGNPSQTTASTLTPLQVAARVGAGEVCQVLTQHSQEAVCSAGPDGMTPLHWAGHGGHAHCVAVLVGAGAMVDCATPTGQRTSLHLASLQGHSEAAEKLLECGASHELAMEPGGERPIHLAALHGHHNVLEVLLRYGCAPDIKQHHKGHTPLHIAASMGHLSCCRLLVEGGADVSVGEATVESHTPLDLAMLGGHGEVASYLISLSAPSRGGKFHRAALTIQAVWRLHRHRRRRRATEQWCAVVIQRAVQQWLRRRRAQRVREARQRAWHRAAAAIQRVWGSYREKKRRYEATSARLRSRLQQEHVAASLLLEELQAQAHSIQLPSTPRAVSLTSPVPQAPPSYLLQASAPPPPLFPSGSLLFPAKPRRPLGRRPPRITVPSTFSKPPSLPALPESREGSSVSVGEEVRFPPISPEPSLTATLPPESQSKVLISRSSHSSRPARSTQLHKMPSRSRASKPSRGRAAVSRSEQQLQPQVEQHTPTQASVSLPAIPNGGVVSSEVGGRVGRSAQPEEERRRRRESVEEMEKKEEEPKKEKEEEPDEKEEEEGQREEEEKEELKEEAGEKEMEEGEEREEQKLSVTATPRRSYLKETVFTVAPLGHRTVRRVGERGEEQATSSGQEGSPAAERGEGLLGHIQRYDRLNHVLSLLHQAQRKEGGAPGEVRLGDLREHIKTALDEAVRLRADTEVLQHKTMLKMKSTANSTNSVKT